MGGYGFVAGDGHPTVRQDFTCCVPKFIICLTVNNMPGFKAACSTRRACNQLILLATEQSPSLAGIRRLARGCDVPSVVGQPFTQSFTRARVFEPAVEGPSAIGDLT